MLTPEYLQGAPAELEALFLRLEEDVIKDICRRIAKEGRLTDSAADQAERLSDLGAGTDYIKEKIAEYSGLSDEAVDRLFFDAAQTSDEFYRNVYDKANKDYTPYEYNDYFQQAVDAAVNQTKGELRNLTQSMGFSYRGSNGQIRFHTAAEAYRDCLDYAFMQTSTGMTDYNTAVRNATRRLTESGLQFVDYASGVRNHADVAVRRAVLTGLSQYTGKIAEHNMQELDTDIVEVDAHSGARPDHAEWQGRWFSFSGKSKEYPSLVEVTGYGTVTGLKGANCRHDFYPVIPGISEPSYTEEELKNIDPPPFEYNGKTYTYYEATQRQRYMERAMRKTKRELLAADSTGDKDRFTEKSVLLRRQKEEYGKFSKAAGLLTQTERTQVYGYDRSKSAKTVWAERKAKLSSISIQSPPNTPRIIYDFKVNHEIIDNPKYYNKYKGVTTSKFPIADKRVADFAKDCMISKDGTEYERLYLLSAFNGKKIKMFNLGIRGGEPFTFDFTKYQSNSIIFVHNHPNNAAFSFEDFITINNHPEIKTIIAAGHDGTVYKLSCNNGKRLDLRNENDYNYYQRRWAQFFGSSGSALGAVEKFADALGWDLSYE